VCRDRCRFQGHKDIISGIGYIPAPLDCYITSSWDQQLRLWKRPLASGSGGAGAAASKASAAAGSGKHAADGTNTEASYLLPEDSEDGNNFVSEFEKAHPLVAPKALSQVRCTACVVQHINVNVRLHQHVHDTEMALCA
jgi:hypothetical protein